MKKMEKEKAQLQAELKQVQKEYDRARGQSRVGLGQLKLIQNKIALQEKLMGTASRELKILKDDIYLSNLEIYRLKGQLDTLKKQYANTVVYAYKNRSSYDFVNFIFSSTSFNDAVKRIAYLKSYRNYRATQMKTIAETQQLIVLRQQQQEKRATQQDEALKNQLVQKDELEVQRKDKDRVVGELRLQEKDLKAKLEQKKKLDQSLQSSITALIRRKMAEEKKADDARKAAERKAQQERIAAEKKAEDERIAAINKARKEAENSGATPPPVTPDVKEAPKTSPPAVAATKPAEKEIKAPESYLEVNAKDIALGSNFTANKGRLPWPVDNCYILIDFGNYKVEGLNISGKNPGLVLATPSAGSPVKAVFDGEVYAIMQAEGYYNVVISHGRYSTVYNYLSSANISKGATVKTGQVIGKTSADDNGTGGQLSFYILIEDKEVNPKLWLRPR